MKKLFIYTLLSLLLVGTYTVGITSCQELNIDSQAEGPVKIVIDAQPEYNIVATTPHAITFNISSNTPWRITSDKEWCKPTPASSDASSLLAEITVAVETNEVEAGRTAILTINAEGVETPTIITIKQDAKGKLEVQPIDDVMGTDGGKTTFTICSNKAWTVTSSNQWLTFDKTAGIGTGQVEIIQATATANPGAKRTATITVKNTLEEKTFEVTQNGIVLELKDPVTGAISFAAAGETKSIEVNANIEWKAETPTDWITFEQDGKILKVTSKYNKYFGTRTGKVILKSKNPNQDISCEFEISQARCVWIQGKEVVDPVTLSGSIAMTDDPTNNRYVTNGTIKLGKFIWKFSNFELNNSGLFEINADENGSPSNSRFVVSISPSKSTFTSFGNYGGWSETVLDITTNELRNMKSFSIEINHDAQNPGKLQIKAMVNDRVLFDQRGKGNPFTNPDEPGEKVYFGFPGWNVKPATCTIDSFEIIPYE